jgi:MFS family permease
VLVFLVVCQIINYFDRGAVSGLVKPLGAEFELSKFEQGMIGGAFMLGYMIFAPLSGFLTQYFRGTRIMAVGLLLWIVAAGVASISWQLYPLLATRMILGFGEATFASIAPSIIDDISVPRTRSLWLSIYFMAVPVGQALGFIAAGYIATLWSWRVVFIIEACLMVPFPIICFFLPEISVVVENGLERLKEDDRVAKEEEIIRNAEQAASIAKRGFFESLNILVHIPV